MRNAIEWNPELDKSIIDMRKRDLSWNEMESRTGFSADTLRSHFKQLVFENPALAPLGRTVRGRRSETIIRDVWRMHQRGIVPDEIAKKLRRGVGQITDIIARVKMRLADKQPAIPAAKGAPPATRVHTQAPPA
jgi:hypothetical protein